MIWSVNECVGVLTCLLPYSADIFEMAELVRQVSIRNPAPATSHLHPPPHPHPPVSTHRRAQGPSTNLPTNTYLLTY